MIPVGQTADQSTTPVINIVRGFESLGQIQRQQDACVCVCACVQVGLCFGDIMRINENYFKA